jgi:outer membrane protein OmpA-like peptidoglycan-associated protein
VLEYKTGSVVALTLSLCGGATGEPNTPQRTVPLCRGLTIVTAISQRDGDYESIKTVESVTPQRIDLKYSAESLENSVIRRITARRSLLPADLASATLYMRAFSNKAAATIPGTTAIGTSSAVLRALKTTGEAELGIFEGVAAAAAVDRNVHPNAYDYTLVEKIRRVEPGPVMLPVIVNDVRLELPTIHARADYYGDRADFHFLDDEHNPLSVRYRIGRDSLDVVKITFGCAASAGARPAATQLEESLLTTGRADVYSIYFSFNSEQIREESQSTLDQIAEVMRRHPHWKLSIEGHTDGIASDSYNLTLSQRRAAAVKQALVSNKAIADVRVATAGFGESRPKDTNDTLDGRARNRRVELVRLP